MKIVPYRDDLAQQFYDINAAWITAMFTLEAHDRDVLENPRARIVDPGGAILFVEHPDLGIIGTCALMPKPRLAVMPAFSSRAARRAMTFSTPCSANLKLDQGRMIWPEIAGS